MEFSGKLSQLPVEQQGELLDKIAEFMSDDARHYRASLYEPTPAEPQLDSSLRGIPYSEDGLDVHNEVVGDLIAKALRWDKSPN